MEPKKKKEHKKRKSRDYSFQPEELEAAVAKVGVLNRQTGQYIVLNDIVRLIYKHGEDDADPSHSDYPNTVLTRVLKRNKNEKKTCVPHQSASKEWACKLKHVESIIDLLPRTIPRETKEAVTAAVHKRFGPPTLPPAGQMADGQDDVKDDEPAPVSAVNPSRVPLEQRRALTAQTVQQQQREADLIKKEQDLKESQLQHQQLQLQHQQELDELKFQIEKKKLLATRDKPEPEAP